MTEDASGSFRTRKRTLINNTELAWGGDDGEEWSEAVDTSTNVTITDTGSVQGASSIPTNGFYLDDFEDGTLTNRSTYSDVTLTPETLEPASSNYSSPKRPTWTQDISNGISVSDSNLVLSGSTDYVMHTPLDVGGDTWDTPIQWEFEVTHDGNSNGNDRYAVALSGTSYTASNNGNNDTYFTSGGYAIALNDAGSLGVRFGRDMDGDRQGLTTTLLEGDAFSSGTTVTFRLTRDSNGTWELFQNGSSKGSVTDTTYTDISYMGIAGDSRANVTVPYFLVK